MAVPVECAHWMRSKGDDIRAYPEEHQPLLNVVVQNSAQTVQIVLDCLNQPLLRIGGKPEGGIGCATNLTIYTRIAKSHK